MKFNVSSHTHAIHLARQAAPAYGALPSSEIYHADGLFGQVVFQLLHTGLFSTLHDFYAIRSAFSLSFKNDDPVLQMLVCMQGDLHVDIAGIGPVHLQQGQFIMLYVPSMNSLVSFAQPAELMVFNLHFPAQSLQFFIPLFPILAFITEMEGIRPALLFKQSGWVTHDILKGIGDLLKFPDTITREYFYEIKVKELLFLFLKQKFYTGPVVMTEAALESVRHARHLIESHVGHAANPAAIAQLVGIDTARLKEDFKTVVGVSMIAFALTAVMNNARLLIMETDTSIHDISVIFGYARPQDFTEAFRRTFNYTPLSLRKAIS